MNHPSHENLGLYVFGEAPPELSRAMRAHFVQCEQCAAQLAAMQGALGKLDAWDVPPPPRRAAFVEPVVKFALAAAIILAVGIGVGRFAGPQPPDAGELRAEMRAALITELNDALAVQAVNASNLIALSEFRLAQQTDRTLRSFGRELLEAVDAGRVQDRASIQTVLGELRQQRDTDYVALRSDLETVASTTAHQLRQAQLNLVELAHSNPKGITP